jgi:sterol desaturase/sphingolipid hydroxylase (fatty acid hydroxylase superfamily)
MVTAYAWILVRNWIVEEESPHLGFLIYMVLCLWDWGRGRTQPVNKLHAYYGIPMYVAWWLWTVWLDIPRAPVSLWQGLVQLVGVTVLYEVWFYHTHRLMHAWHWQPHFTVHHHGEIDPDSALYSHPLEYVGNTVGPVFVLLVAFQVGVWLGLGILVGGYVSTTLAHRPNNGPHHLHHQLKTVNFGALTWFDRLYGTYLSNAC